LTWSGLVIPIGDYAVIGDCRTAALVSRSGSIDWLCLPHFSAPSIFGALLDRRRGGSFALRPRTDDFTATRRYVGPTNVLQTTFATATGKASVTDLMSMPPDLRRIEPMREVLRIVEGVEGELEMLVHAEPRPDYGRSAAGLSARGRLGWAWGWGDELLSLCTDVPLHPGDGAFVRGCFTIRSGETRCFSLCYTGGDIGSIAPLGAAAQMRRQSTLAWWADWARHCNYEGPHRELVLRSALTLKGMTYALSGAVIAAPTTSLPETLGGTRNWDYRYCWLRDAAITMRAFTSLGFMSEASAFLSWLLHATRLTWPELRVVYDVYGRTDMPELELSHWDGYAASQPVRIGNAAVDQFQLDVYGNVAFAAHNFVASGGVLQRDEARLLRGLATSVMRSWRKPDHGMWEVRGMPRQYTSSKVLCWMALHCLSELQHDYGVSMPAGLDAERDAIAAVIERDGFNPELGSYVAELGGAAADASLLLMSTLGYKPANDPRMRGTYAFTRQRLARNGLWSRYERNYDSLGAEGAFGLCSFWAVEHMARSGQLDAARGAFERITLLANDVGLFAEEFDPDTGVQLGNFPQAFTHVGLINAALALAGRAEPSTS